MIKFRGITEEGKEVKGYYVHTSWKHYIIEDYTDHNYSEHFWHEVILKSVAMFTTRLDKNKKEIYGSIPIDGEMSRGGDELIFTFPNGETIKIGVFWNPESLCWALEDGIMLANFDNIEVIGRQWKE